MLLGLAARRRKAKDQKFLTDWSQNQEYVWQKTCLLLLSQMAHRGPPGTVSRSAFCLSLTRTHAHVRTTDWGEKKHKVYLTPCSRTSHGPSVQPMAEEKINMCGTGRKHTLQGETTKEARDYRVISFGLIHHSDTNTVRALAIKNITDWNNWCDESRQLSAS